MSTKCDGANEIEAIDIFYKHIILYLLGITRFDHQIKKLRIYRDIKQGNPNGFQTCFFASSDRTPLNN